MVAPIVMTFNDILHKFRSESFTEHDKGTQFERLMRLWLLSDPRYSNLTDVWLWEDFPSRGDLGGRDTGIDLVARADNGEYWAIQCKCYKEDAIMTSLLSILSLQHRVASSSMSIHCKPHLLLTAFGFPPPITGATMPRKQ